MKTWCYEVAQPVVPVHSQTGSQTDFFQIVVTVFKECTSRPVDALKVLAIRIFIIGIIGKCKSGFVRIPGISEYGIEQQVGIYAVVIYVIVIQTEVRLLFVSAVRHLESKNLKWHFREDRAI